jgi:hypothetical protein
VIGIENRGCTWIKDGDPAGRVQSGFYPLVTGKFRTVFHLMVPFHGFPLWSFLPWPEQDTYLRGTAELIPARPTPWKTIILLCGKCDPDNPEWDGDERGDHAVDARRGTISRSDPFLREHPML